MARRQQRETCPPQGRYSATAASRASVRVPRQHRRDTKWLSGLSALALSCIRARIIRARVCAARRASAEEAARTRASAPLRHVAPPALPRPGFGRLCPLLPASGRAAHPQTQQPRTPGVPLSEPLLTVHFCLTPETCPRPQTMTQCVACLHAVLRHSLRGERRLRSQHPRMLRASYPPSRSPSASHARPRAHV